MKNMKKRYVLKNRRRFFTLVMILMVMTITLLFATSAYGYKEPTFEKVTVSQGDTLWDLAKEYGSKEDIRSFIRDIKKANGMTTSMIYEGQELLIPQ